MLLDGVVGEMDEGVVDGGFGGGELLGGEAGVALLEEVDVVVVVDERPVADVELAFVDEQRALDVLLDDEGFRFDPVALRGFPFASALQRFLHEPLRVLLHHLPQPLQLREHPDPSAPIKLRGFQQPQIRPLLVVHKRPRHLILRILIRHRPVLIPITFNETFKDLELFHAGCGVDGGGVMLGVEDQEVREDLVAVVVVEVDDEGGRGEREHVDSLVLNGGGGTSQYSLRFRMRSPLLLTSE